MADVERQAVTTSEVCLAHELYCFLLLAHACNTHIPVKCAIGLCATPSVIQDFGCAACVKCRILMGVQHALKLVAYQLAFGNRKTSVDGCSLAGCQLWRVIAWYRLVLLAYCVPPPCTQCAALSPCQMHKLRRCRFDSLLSAWWSMTTICASPLQLWQSGYTAPWWWSLLARRVSDMSSH